MLNPIIQNFIDSVCTVYTGRKISVKFFNTDYYSPFTFETFYLLVSDPITEYIIDAETGELLFDGHTKEITL